MRNGGRFLISSAIISLVLISLSWTELQNFFDQYDMLTLDNPGPPMPLGSVVGDKIIVMAKLEQEDTNWVAEELPDWQRAIYTVNPSNRTDSLSHPLVTPLNKGHESMAYLTYIIDNYNSSLPSIVAFLHSHRSGFFKAWHVDDPSHNNVAAMRALQLGFVIESGYVNLRCNWNPGCKAAHRRNKHVSHAIWDEIFTGTSTPPLNWSSITEDGVPLASVQDGIGRGLNTPMHVGAACCAQFAVSQTQILKRPVEDYIKFRQWIIDTDQDDAHSGRVMEFLWHVIFGKDPVFCPPADQCYCQVYGRC